MKVTDEMVTAALCAKYGEGDVSDMLRGCGDEETSIMRAALTAAIALMRGQSEVPFGKVLAPVEPTHEMLAMFWRVCNGADWPKSAGTLTKRQLGRAKRAYGLMLSAIPAPPKDTADEQ